MAIECLTGRAGHLFSGQVATTVVAGKLLLRPSPNEVYLQGDGWQEAVVLSPTLGASSVGAQILATVQPTGRAC